MRALGILLLLTAWMPIQSVAQTKVLANEVTYTSGNDKMTSLVGCGPLLLNPCYAPTVENPNNALANDNNYARLLASPGLALDLGSYKGVIELKFAQTLPADTWSYVRMEGDSELFKALLGGSLGNLLGDVLGYVLIGNQEVIIDARMGGTTVLSRSSTQGFGTDRVKLIQDGDGNNYLAIRPASDYDRLRITNQTGSLLGLGIEKTLDIYNAFYYEDIGNDCDRPFATSFDGGGGIGLEVGDLNDQNLGNAIDNDENSFSRLKSSSVLNLNVASTLSQYFYFPTTSAETTTANIKLALGSGGLVNTDLLGAIEIIFFEDNTIVSRRSLQSSLLNNTNALTLLDSGEPVTLTFAPGKAFDRIAIKLNSPVGVNLLGNGVKIYDVQRYDDIAGCPNPLIAAIPSATNNPFDNPTCASGLIDFENVDFAQRAVDGNNESYATIYADAGNLLVSGPTEGFIEMDLGNVPANKTTYVRINYDDDVLDRLLGGSLGKLVGDLANNLLLGNQYIQVEALDGSNIVLNENSSDAFEGQANGVVSLVEDNIGRYYIAITPDSDYTSIRITNHVEALLPTGKKASLDVYNACFEIGDDFCFPPNFTSYKGGGANLSLGDLSEVGVKDPYKAISGNSSEYSEINLGALGLLSDVYQTIYFSQPSQVDDHVQIRLMVEPSSALSADVLGAYKIKFFNGKEQVGPDYNLQDYALLNNLDVLALFNSGGTVTLDFEPEGTFDRVDIGAESVVELNVDAEPLRVYSVKRYGDQCPLTITESPFENSASCIAELIDSHNADEVQNLFDEDFDSYATLKSGAGFLLGLGNQYEGYVEMGYAQIMDAGTTSYIRIDFDDGVLGALVSGSLGNVVSGLLDGLALGDHYFKVEAKNADDVVLEGSSKEDGTGATDQIRIVQDALGRYYIAVTPDQDYNRIRITDVTNSALGLLAEPNTMNVYGMCTELSTDACLPAFATSYEYSGLNLGVDAVGSAGVTNPEYALDDGNSQHYSEISNGTLGVGASTKQWIYFNSVSEADDTALIKFKTGAGGVDLDVLGGLEIKAYLGNDEVATLDWQDGLINGINVLDLINNGDMVEVPFTPGDAYDRISVGIKTLVGVSVFPPVELYDVSRCYTLSSSKITSWKSYIIDGNVANTSVSGGEEVEYTIHVKNTGTEDLAGFTISDELPEGLTWVSGGTHNAGVVSFSTTSAIVVDETKTFSFKAKVTEDLTDIEELKNIAYVQLNGSNENVPSYPPVDNTTPANPDINEEPGTVIPVEAIYDYAVLKNGVSNGTNSNQVAVNDEITYTISLENIGNKKLTNVSVKDTIQNDIYTEITIVDAGGGVVNGDEIDFTINELNVGDTAEFTIITKVVALPTAGEVTNKAMLSYTTPNNISVDKEVTFVMVSNCDPVEANAIELTADIQEAICSGTSVELTATLATGAPAISNPVFKWYKNADLSDTPQIGESITVNPMATTTYYVTVEDAGYCYSGNPQEIEVEVLPNATADDIEVSGPNEVCVGEEVTLSAALTSTGTTISNPEFKWYLDEDLTNKVHEGEEFNIIPDASLLGVHTLYVTVEGDGICANMLGATATKQVTVNPKPTINISGNKTINVAVGTQINWPNITAEGENANPLTVNYFDANGNSINSLPNTIATAGTYTYTVSAEEGSCSASETLIVNVYDADVCPPTMERVYANSQSWGSIITGGVSNRPNATDGNPKTYSTITTGLGLLGIGTTWQNLFFEETVPAGTPVTIKLGKEYSGLVLAGGLSVVGIGENGLDIGVIQPVDGGLLDLLVADNVVEYTFVPSNLSGAQNYTGIRISQGSLVGVAQNAKVYGAYYEKPGVANCDPIDNETNPDVLDVLHGVKDLGLGVASATASVSNPWNAVDNDLDTYAMMSRGVAVANRAFLNVVFKQQAMPGDELHIVTEVPGNPILSLELIKGYKIQRFLGDQPVGPELDNNSGVLRLKLLGLGYANKYKIIVTPYDEPYDRVKISYGSVVGVLGDFTKIYDVSIVPEIDIPESPTELCLGDNLVLNPTDICTIYDVYTTETGMDKWQVVNEFEFEMPEDLTAGLHTLYVQAIRNGCPIGERQEIKVEINDIPILDDIKIDNQTFAFDTTIEVSPGDVVEVIPTIDWGDSNKQEIVWEMENPETPSEWIAIPFAETEVDGTIKFTIPDFGEVTLPDNTVIDIRSKDIPIRLILESDKGCQTIEEGMLLRIDGKSQLIVNPNITNKLKN